MNDHLTPAALALARNGFFVFPVTNAKKPTVRYGWRAATRDPFTISCEFSERGVWGVAVATELSRVVAVDVDTKAHRDGRPWLRSMRHVLAANPTRVHRTPSGGYHFLFCAPAGPPLPSSVDAVAPGVDMKARGGYVLAPPSPGYELARDLPLAPLPAQLQDSILAAKNSDCQSDFSPASTSTASTITSAPVYGRAALDRALGDMRCAKSRAVTLNAVAYNLGRTVVAAGALDENEALAALVAAATAVPGDHPFTATEASRVARAGMAAGLRHAGGVHHAA